MPTKTPLKIQNGLAFKMILYIFVSIMVIFIGIFHYNLRYTRGMVEDHLKANAEYLTISSVAKVEQVLAAIQKIGDNYIHLFEQEGLDKKMIHKYLKLITETNKDIVGSCLAFEPGYWPGQGDYYAPYYFRKGDTIEYAELGGVNYNYHLMDWYQLPREIGRPIWTEPYFDAGGADMVLSTYALPVYGNTPTGRRVIGVLTIDISLDWLDRFIRQIKVAETGYGFIISKTGNIVTHPKREFIMNESVFSIADEQNSPDLRRIGQNMINGDTSFAKIEYINATNQKKSWIAYAPIKLNGWSIGIVFPVDEFMWDVNRLRRLIIGLGLGGGFLLILIIILISRSITRPLRRLTAATEAFSQGDFLIELPETHGSDEIARLNKAFKTMQSTLSDTIRDLQKTTNDLAASHEKLEEYNRTLEERVEDTIWICIYL